MTQTFESINAGFSLSPKFFELFSVYCSRNYPRVSLCLRSVICEIVYEVMTDHVLKLIDIFSKKNKEVGLYIPHIIGSGTQLTQEFAEEFLQRICITEDGSDEFLAQLHKEILKYAKENLLQEERNIYWDPQKEAIMAVSYEIPKFTFNEELGREHPICADLLMRIELRILGVKHNL